MKYHLYIFLIFCIFSRKEEKNAGYYNKLAQSKLKEAFNSNNEAICHEALTLINKAILLQSDSIGHYIVRSVIYEKTGKIDSALRDMDIIISMKEKDPKAIGTNGLAYSYLRKGKFNLVLSENKKALEDITKAISIIEAIMEKNPLRRNDTSFLSILSQSYAQKGNCFMSINKPDSALYYYNEVIKKQYSTEALCNAYIGLSSLEQDKKNFTKALDYINKAIEYEKEDPTAYAQKGSIYFDSQQYEEAFQYYSKSLSLYPNDVRVLSNYAIIQLLIKKDYKAAIQNLNKVIELVPNSSDNSTNYLNIGFAKKQLGDLQGSIEANRKSLEFEKTSEAYFNLAMDYSDISKNDSALFYVEKAIKLNSKDETIHNLKGVILMDIGKLKEAKEAFKVAIKINPSYELAKNNLNDLK